MNTIWENEALVEAFSAMPETSRSRCISWDLLSDGGVHSLDKHLYKLCDMTGDYGIEECFYSCFWRWT